MGVNISSIDAEGQAVLHAALSGSQVNTGIVQSLVENGFRALRSNVDSGPTSLSYAMDQGQTDLVRMFLEHIRQNYDGDFENADDASIIKARFMLAVDDNDVGLIAYLLERGADVDMKLGAVPARPIHRAVIRNSTTVMSLLLRWGCDIEVRDNLGRTPLHRAASKNDEELEAMCFLLDHGADIQAADHSGNTPLHFAAGCGSLAALQFLVDRGACPESLNERGLTPLLYAFESPPLDHYHHREPSDIITKVELLIEKGASISGEIGEKMLATAVDENIEALVRLLLSKGVDPTKEAMVPNFMFHPSPPIAICTKNGDIELVHLLLDYGADATIHVRDVPEGDTFTLLHHAVSAYTGSTELVRLLLDKGADPLVLTRKEMTMLHHFISSHFGEGDTEVIDILLEHGVDLNARCGLLNRTALHYAVEFRKLMTVKHLIDRGIDVEAKDDEGMTALDIARERGYEMMAIFLTSYMRKKDRRNRI